MSVEHEEPVVNVCEVRNPPLKPEQLAELTPLQKFMRSKLGCISLGLLAFTICSVPVIAIPPPLFLLGWLGLIGHWPLRRFFDLCTANWMTVMTLLFESVIGIKTRTFGHSGVFKRRSLIVMNHISHFDWMYFWSVADRQGDLTFWKVITKMSPLKYLPILGHCMQFSCHMFLNRVWKHDEPELRKKLYYFNAINYPIQLLLFPEGGDFNTRRKRLSDKWADEQGLPHYDYLAHPRTKGFVYVVNALRSGGLDAVYDVTIGFPDVLPKTELDFVMKSIIPKEIHFHVKKYEIKDLPESDEELEGWLRERWREKEDLLKHFYTHGEYREEIKDTSGGVVTGKQSVTQRNGHLANGSVGNRYRPAKEVIRKKRYSYLLYSFFVIFSTNSLVFLLMYYVPFFWVYMIFGCLFLALGGTVGGGLGHLLIAQNGKHANYDMPAISKNK